MILGVVSADDIANLGHDKLTILDEHLRNILRSFTSGNPHEIDPKLHFKHNEFKDMLGHVGLFSRYLIFSSSSSAVGRDTRPYTSDIMCGDANARQYNLSDVEVAARGFGIRSPQAYRPPSPPAEPSEFFSAENVLEKAFRDHRAKQSEIDMLFETMYQLVKFRGIVL